MTASPISPRDPAEAGSVEKAARAAIESFLHPLRGGPERRGWEMGRGVYLSDLAAVLGFDLVGRARTLGEEPATPYIELLVALRNEARAAKSWSLADRVRDGLAELGVTLEDGPGGTTWRR